MVPSTLVDIKQFCEIYPFRKWTIRSYCSQGKIPYVKVGKRVYFNLEDIERWLANKVVTVSPPAERNSAP